MDTPSPQIQQKIAVEQKLFSPQSNWIDTLFRTAIKNRESVILVYKLLFFSIVGVILLGGYASYYLTDSFLFFYDLALWSGKIGMVFYILTVIPGIARRFGIKHKLISLLMIFRRYNGIAMFLSIWAHYIILRGAQLFRNGPPTTPPPIFETLGFVAFVFSALLFLTSNDFAVTHLKKWWNKIHQLTYVIIWLIAFHILLQRVSIWSISISIAVVLQIASYVYSRFTRSTQKMSPKPVK